MIHAFDNSASVVIGVCTKFANPPMTHQVEVEVDEIRVFREVC